ncbi:lysophospholipid acyltransferase family protein [Streptococcus sp. DD12]|uniref:lysophospholipid acyltransferase family protein n=1 Tax=Streptococcus sp. DD12 TaxID=1777880 RepID=UPI000799F0B6|nr:1-acyl-sn-glycerol-3-phosphate acyltransferase [Streptococcus sp. DD12]KXT76184.1 1-acyl-sn-glycerol-3-phosphate acyltransferase [Streptococcus sp. DD12]
MFYAYLQYFATFLLYCVNGNAHYHNRKRLPDLDENVILVAPHRTWWDPVYLAFSTKPRKYVYMAKQELFKNRALGWFIKMCGAFPINRQNPGQEAIKYPVKMLKKSQRSLIMFPSGSRHASDVKGGVAVIAKMAKVRIVPAVYGGPRDFSSFIKGARVDMNYGEPIDISDIKRMNDQGIEEVSRRLQEAFDQLDAENESLTQATKFRPLWWLLRIPLGILAILLTLLTVAFAFLASFVWDPDKHRENELQ